MKIEVRATVTYTYDLPETEEQKLIELIKNNPEDYRYMLDEDRVALAFERLYTDTDENLELYNNNRTVESDFVTDEFSYSEFNDIDAEDWIDNNGLRDIVDSEMYMDRREQSCK